MLFIIKRKLTAIMPYIGFPANILYQLSLYFSDCFHFHLVVCVSFFPFSSRVSKYDPWARFHPLPIIVNKVLFKHSHAQSFLYCI